MSFDVVAVSGGFSCVDLSPSDEHGGIDYNTHWNAI
jgi:hypothetical protein